MRISMVSEHASPLASPGSVDAGGQNVHVAALPHALADRGHAVTVFTRRDAPDLPERVWLRNALDVVHLSAGPQGRVAKDDLLPHMDELAQGLSAHWRADPPDVVHGHFWMSGLACLMAARSLDPVATPPVFQTFHALGVVKRRHQGAKDTSPPEREWLEPHVARDVDTVIATCSDEASELQAMGVPAHRIAIAPCGADTALFRPDGAVEPKRAPYRVAVVSRLVPRKGVDVAIEAMGRLAADGRRDIELVVAGSSQEGGVDADPEIARLRRFAGSLGVSDIVDFRGQVPREHIPALLRSADVAVCTPWYEPFGIVPLEAMACGTPVIAASVGGLVDTVLDGVTGAQVPARDPLALADAIRCLLADDDARERLGRAGHDRVMHRYTWDRVAATTEGIYSDALAQAHRRAHTLEQVVV